ncbi:MAG TPA: DUF5118 domain-containing protein, partial [Burkholderiaceae bacterium]
MTTFSQPSVIPFSSGRFALSMLAAAALLAGCASLNPDATTTASAGAAKPAAGAASAPAGAASANGGTAARPPQTAANTAPPPPSGVPPGTPQPATAPPGSPQPFANVIKDAKKIDGGLFTMYQKDEKVWLELRPEDFNKPFFMSPKIATGIGENALFGGLMDEPQ